MLARLSGRAPLFQQSAVAFLCEGLVEQAVETLGGGCIVGGAGVPALSHRSGTAALHVGDPPGGRESALSPGDFRTGERRAGADGGDLVQEVQREASGAGRCAEDCDLVEGVAPEHAGGLAGLCELCRGASRQCGANRPTESVGSGRGSEGGGRPGAGGGAEPGVRGARATHGGLAGDGAGHSGGRQRVGQSCSPDIEMIEPP